MDTVLFPQNDLDAKYYDLGWSTIRYRGKINILIGTKKVVIKYTHISTNENAMISVNNARVKIFD